MKTAIAMLLLGAMLLVGGCKPVRDRQQDEPSVSVTESTQRLPEEKTRIEDVPGKAELLPREQEKPTIKSTKDEPEIPLPEPVEPPIETAER